MKCMSGSHSRATMQPMMGAAAEFIAGVIMRGGTPAKVLDVAASHGLFGIAVARLAPRCEIVAQDFPSVLTVTAQNARAAGVSDHPSPRQRIYGRPRRRIRRRDRDEFLPSFSRRGQHRFDEALPCCPNAPAAA